MKIFGFGRGLVGVIGSGLVAVLAGPAAAAPIMVGIGSFSGSETVIDFQGLADGIGVNVPINTQYAGSGITFSGGLWANNNPSTAALIPGSNGQVATNFFQYGGCLGAACGQTLTIDLSSTALRVGFDVATNDSNDLLIDVAAYSGNTLVSTGSFNVNTGLAGMFVGIEDSTLGIDRLELTPTGVGNGALVIDNVRFEGTVGAVVPEPSAALLFPIGLLAAAARLRRPRQLA